ncbi:hypothetical protein [Ideonella livida]|uniref:Uncharacterized protein n=1 Tax=Ideonella livida TaxID=2707176 RepID=A0A7C9PFH7_9BURK|nr:hypothetical protein [Ideonella livida]NDY89754.1 hypothetical protein [Ideonella livida]
MEYRDLASRLRGMHAAAVPAGFQGVLRVLATPERMADLLVAADALEAQAAHPKPLDDPRLQELFMSAITGALAFGSQDTNPPPVGHWLKPAWDIGRVEAVMREQEVTRRIQAQQERIAAVEARDCAGIELRREFRGQLREAAREELEKIGPFGPVYGERSQEAVAGVLKRLGVEL